MKTGEKIMDEITHEELLRDLIRVDKEVEGKMTQQQYKDLGNYSLGTVTNKFGSFNRAKETVGLKVNSVGDSGLTRERILQEIKYLVYETDKKFNIANLAEELDITKDSLTRYFHDNNNVDKRFDGVFDALKAAGITEEDVYQRWEEAILDQKMYGYIDYSDFKKSIVEHSQFGFFNGSKDVNFTMKKLKEYVNDNEDNGLKLNNTKASHNGAKVFVKNQNIDPYAKYRERIPDDKQAREAFQKCIGHGYSPKTTVAALIYIFTDKTQDEVHSDIGCSSMSIRNVRDFIKENELVKPWPNQID